MKKNVIRYNLLNLPDTIQFRSGHQIVNLYDAAGHKYKSVIYTNTAAAGTQYDDIAHYPNSISCTYQKKAVLLHRQTIERLDIFLLFH